VYTLYRVFFFGECAFRVMVARLLWESYDFIFMGSIKNLQKN